LKGLDGPTMDTNCSEEIKFNRSVARSCRELHAEQ
jgi:hypothetical protein